MKKIFLSLVLILSFASCATSAPVYKDDIPIDHLNKAKSIQEIKYQDNIQEDLPESNQVKIYSKYKRYVQGQFITSINRFGLPCEPFVKKYRFKNGVNLYDKVDLLTKQDVYKNGVLYIKKDTVVTGIVTVAEFPLVDWATMQPSELRISKFTTTDVNGNTIKLYGELVNRPIELGPLAALAGAPARVSKKVVYTLYYK